ncbi:MAG: DEAD/DEAH box helicase [Deltaproteobacteria bacterium]|jgi:superfamily II RNA helicase|nr:DEAD/DEAH box helicase [Deltaproteobacteria bacterium]
MTASPNFTIGPSSSDKSSDVSSRGVPEASADQSEPDTTPNGDPKKSRRAKKKKAEKLKLLKIKEARRAKKALKKSKNSQFSSQTSPPAPKAEAQAYSSSKPAKNYPPQPLTIEKPVCAYLDNIGVPESKPFKPDSFQLKAAALIEHSDVIVSAPTGSGKTWIAKQALLRELQAGHNSWYASPLKALSNSKYLEFGSDFGAGNVGLLTGEHKYNSHAPIVVGTTEILRNHLYDSMTGSSDLNLDLVVLDEAHYLGDSERGVVWEEVLIYMPSRVRFLLLSATIENASELAAWLEHHRRNKVRVVRGGDRPVPLVPLCLHSSQLDRLETVIRKDTEKKKSKPYRPYVAYNKRFQPEKPPATYLPRLVEQNLLPAIFFLPSRKNCDSAVMSAPRNHTETQQKLSERTKIIDRYIEQYPYLAKYPATNTLRSKGMAAHHAGHLPQFKLLVEELMSKNLLSAIFATSTVAAGVNFPARTVVIPQSDRFNGTRFMPLTATELAQMTGRAGRRGLDNIGFAILLKGQHQDLKLMGGLFDSPPDPVNSALNIDFSMTLNLLKVYEFDRIHDLLAQSFSAWQSVKRHTAANLKRASDYKYKLFQYRVKFLIEVGLVTSSGRLTSEGLLAAKLRVDNPLIMYAAITSGAMPLSLPHLAGLTAALAAPISGDDKFHEDRNLSNRLKFPHKQHSSLASEFTNLQRAVKPMITMLKKWDFPAPIGFDDVKTTAVFDWTSHHNFNEAVKILRGYPGDLVRLVLLTAENLNQIAGLDDFPELTNLATSAESARQAIMVSPVI